MTAVSSVSSLDTILKEFYSGPIRDQLNNEMLVFELFNRKKMNWVGRRVIMPVRVARNEKSAFAADNGTLPDPGEQTYKDLTITAKYLYGRMSITGPAIAQAKASVGAFVNGLQQELDGAVESVKNAADQACFTGGGAVGFISEKSGALSTFQFSGNIDQIPGAATAGVRCVLVRSDTYAVISVGGGGGNLAVRQSATAGSIDFRHDVVGGAETVDLSGLAKGAVCTVVIMTDTPAAATQDRLNEALGIYGNLGAGYFDAAVAAGGAPTHWGTDRTTATGTATILQSTIECVENEIAGGVANSGARVAVDTKRMQGILDTIADLSGSEPNCMIAHYIFRQEYTALMSFTTTAVGTTTRNVNVDDGDPGFNLNALSFNGIPLKVARHCGKGLLIFLNLQSWVCAEVAAPALADMDGSVLSRLTNSDAYEAFVRYYYNTVCTAPNRNGILTGISYAGV
jgi:hypothetical protein